MYKVWLWSHLLAHLAEGHWSLCHGTRLSSVRCIHFPVNNLKKYWANFNQTW